jgi:hypothetical protein
MNTNVLFTHIALMDHYFMVHILKEYFRTAKNPRFTCKNPLLETLMIVSLRKVEYSMLSEYVLISFDDSDDIQILTGAYSIFTNKKNGL